MATSVDTLFRPFKLKGLELRNRIAMSPMTRRRSPNGIPTDLVAAYYRRRAESGVGLVMTEGVYIASPSAGDGTSVPRCHTPEQIAAWKNVTSEVHRVGGKIALQLWHIGQAPRTTEDSDPAVILKGPSGYFFDGKTKDGVEFTEKEVEDLVKAYADTAAGAKKAGFDAVEVHAGHGYLVDQFFWDKTNRRTDKWGGDMVQRTRFGVEVTKAVRAAVGNDFPISFRWSQWKIGDYTGRLAETPQLLEQFLKPLVDSGVDIFDCSTRRFWEPEFPGSDLNLAGWTKKITGMPTMTVGSISLSTDVMTREGPALTTDINRLVEMMERGDFDMCAVGRALIADFQWADKVRSGKMNELKPFDRAITTQPGIF